MSRKEKESPFQIMVGMGSVDDYPAFVEAGADEVFLGYVPFSWVKKYGNRIPLNRREVLYYNVQIGSESELEILKDMVEEYKVPVTIVMNSLAYEKDMYPILLKIMQKCIKSGFSRFILADPKFMEYLTLKQKEVGLFQDRTENKMTLIASGEIGEINFKALDYLNEIGISRVIFPRQTTIDEMKMMIENHPNLEYEAFILNEKCHFTGAYCNSIHCDELCHICRIPYRLSRKEGPDVSEEESFHPKDDMEPFHKNNPYEQLYEEAIIGGLGCGLCALWKLREAGITHLKIVSRGKESEAVIQDIMAVKKAMGDLENACSQVEYIQKMKEHLFPGGCSRNCYYFHDS